MIERKRAQMEEMFRNRHPGILREMKSLVGASGADREVKKRSNEIVKYIYYLSDYGVGFSRDILHFIEPRLLMADGIEKFIKIQLKLGKLDERMTVRVCPLFETYISHEKQLGLEFGFESEEVSHYKEAMERKENENKFLIMKSILQIYKQ